MIMLGTIGAVAITVLIVIPAVVVGTYLFLRNNKKKKAAIDGFVNKVDAVIKK